ncbi:MAG: NAD(P)/FAD-dependent oxidoreductase [Treponema sp.]|jgi:phytoene dehydrogenase-like protein|nr:NAD(P)/FAD-dependent oxidoreductase [Treponema sp.]
MKQVVIIGAGVAGLTAGIYALRSGFKAMILEAHSGPGGFCTSWRRGGYLFEGGMHWLTGSSPKTPLHRIWKETGALNETVPVYVKDPFLSVESGGETACFYRDSEKLKEHFLSISPEDKKEILSLYRDIKRFSVTTVPVMDPRGLKLAHKRPFPLALLLGMLPALLRMPRLNRMTAAEYAARFRHQGIRLLLENVVEQSYNVGSLLFTLGCFASGDGGYPEGGSLNMARRMAGRFESLGGTIRYNCKAEKIRLADAAGRRGSLKTAEGVYAGREFIPADAVIVSADTLAAIDRLFDPALHEPWMETMRRCTRPLINTFISLGVKADLSHLPENLYFNLKRPFTYAGFTVASLGFNNYASYKGYAPSGCSALTVSITADTYDYWQAASKAGEYRQRKEELAEIIIDRLAEEVPQIRDRVEVRDVATPLTYERYCGAYRGSWMTFMGKNEPMRSYPCKPRSISNLYFAGQRMLAPGGLPVAVLTGRQAVQRLCRDTGTVFEGAD